MADLRPSSRSAAPLWLPLVAMLGVLLLRVAGQHHLVSGWPNLSPLMALAFTGTLVFPKPLPWWSWAIVLLGVDALSTGSGWWNAVDARPQVLLAYGCYAFAAWWAGHRRGRAGMIEAVAGTLCCSVIFFLVTNTVCWWIEPYYAKSLSGWVQALTIGQAGVIPTTLVFFRNSLIADLSGALVLLLIYNVEALARHIRILPWTSERPLPV
jgi:hypothetical protein